MEPIKKYLITRSTTFFGINLVCYQLHKDSFVSIEKAERVLGWVPKYSNKQALVRNYEWYLDNLHIFEGKSGVSHRVPWKQGILKFAKIFF